MKNQVKNLFNLQSFDAMKAGPTQQNDAGILLSRHLTAVNPNILEVKYANLVFPMLGIEINNFGGYAQEIQTLRLAAQGSFGEEGKARGKVTITAEDTKLPVRVREVIVEWTHRQAQEAQLGHYNVIDRSMAAGLKAYAQEIDTSALLGLDTVPSSKGLLNNTDYTTSAASGAFSALTARQKYDLIADEITAQHNGVNNIDEYQANVVLLPTNVYNSAQNTILNTYSNGSILTILRANFPSISFIHSAKAQQVGGADNRVMALFSTSKDAVAFRIPVPLRFTTVSQVHNDFSTVGTYHNAGLDILEPSSGRIVTGL